MDITYIMIRCTFHGYSKNTQSVYPMIWQSAPPGTYSSNEDQSDNGPTGVQSLSESSHHWHQSSVQESSGISPLHVQAPTQSLSVSLSQTRSLLSELSEFLNQPKVPVKAKGKKSTARVFTSAESSLLLIEKEKKKKKRKKLQQREKRRERGKTKKRKLRNNGKLKPRKRGKKKQQPRRNLRLNNLMPKPKRYQ